MTRKEAAIVTAYTGYLTGDLKDVYDYLSEVVGRPVYTHEIPSVLDLYHEAIRKDFIQMEVT